MSDFITYNNLLSKNYLNLSYTIINSPTECRQLLTLLARAIFKKKQNYIEKNKLNYSTTFETVKVSSSLTVSTVHSILSPAVTSNILAMVAGTAVLTAFVLLAPLLIVVFCLNNTTITSNFVISYTYIYIIKYIKLLIKSILLKVTFIYYNLNINYHNIFQGPPPLKNITYENPMSDLNEKI